MHEIMFTTKTITHLVYKGKEILCIYLLLFCVFAVYKYILSVRTHES